MKAFIPLFCWTYGCRPWTAGPCQRGSSPSHRRTRRLPPGGSSCAVDTCCSSHPWRTPCRCLVCKLQHAEGRHVKTCFNYKGPIGLFTCKQHPIMQDVSETAPFKLPCMGKCNVWGPRQTRCNPKHKNTKMKTWENTNKISFKHSGSQETVLYEHFTRSRTKNPQNTKWNKGYNKQII